MAAATDGPWEGVFGGGLFCDGAFSSVLQPAAATGTSYGPATLPLLGAPHPAVSAVLLRKAAIPLVSRSFA